MTTNLEKIIQACTKANPEIMELKFGCKFKRTGTNSVFIFVHRDGENYRTNEGSSFTKWKWNQIKSGYEILGREIRLADVLLAMGHEIYIYKLSNKAHFSSTVKDIRCNYFNSWDLLHDNLELQSPQTLQFIAELL